jgi:hypothetical protein
MGELAVQGSVTIDGAPAATGSTIFSGNRLVTGTAASAVASVQGSRLTLAEETDAIVTFADDKIRVDVICGSAAAVAAAGMTIEIIAHDDTSVYVASGVLQVDSGGQMTEMIQDQNMAFVGGSRIVVPGGGAVETASQLCACKCAPPGFMGPTPWWMALIVGPGALALLLFDDTPGQVSPSTFG